MNNLTITKEQAQAAHKQADQSGKQMLELLFGKEIFSSGKITDRIKTFDDACEALNIKPDWFKEKTTHDSEDELAYKKLKIIARALNEGWVPNWDNEDEYKYYPYFDMRNAAFSYVSCNCTDWYADVGSRLVYKSAELAEYAGKQFVDIYKEYMANK